MAALTNRCQKRHSMLISSENVTLQLRLGLVGGLTIYRDITICFPHEIEPAKSFPMTSLDRTPVTVLRLF